MPYTPAPSSNTPTSKARRERLDIGGTLVPGPASQASGSGQHGRQDQAPGPASHSGRESHHAAVGSSARGRPARSYSHRKATRAVMCQQNTGMARPLATTTARQGRRRASQRSSAGRASSTRPSWKAASAATQAVVGRRFPASPRVATIECE